MAFEEECEEELVALYSWAVLTSLVPIVFSFVSFILITLTVWRVKKMMSVCDGISLSAHWLSRTAVRVGIGATAKQTLLDYAKTKPELQRLIDFK